MNKAVDEKVSSFLDIYDKVNMWYDVVNTNNDSSEYQQKILERMALREKQRQRIIKMNNELREENERLRKRVEVLENKIPKPTSVEAVIPFAEYYYKDNIAFSQEAKKSLLANAEAGYTQKYIDGIFEQLGYINLWVKYMRNEITKNEYESKVNSSKISNALSESTENKYKSAYTENGVLIDKHVYMSWLPNCARPRTYFGWDKKHNRALISTMCEHKVTSLYR